jgi:formylglycine-generating enzyme required for sulfatase activity
MGTRLGYEEEQGEIKTRVKGYWIDQTEVTVAEFAAFVTATGYQSEAEREGGAVVFNTPLSATEMEKRPYSWWTYRKGADWRHPEGNGSFAVANHPVTMVTLADALAYAKWLGRDLPTEAEWEYAAKAGQSGANLEKEPRDAQGQPIANFWQGDFPMQNTSEDGHQGLAPVGCYAANPFNLFDMIGNAWEQTKDVYTANHLIPSKVSSLAVDQQMVVKGGSHLCGKNFCVRYRPSAREAHEANLPISHIGFRTVSRDVESLLSANFEAW